MSKATMTDQRHYCSSSSYRCYNRKRRRSNQHTATTNEKNMSNSSFYSILRIGLVLLSLTTTTTTTTKDVSTQCFVSSFQLSHNYHHHPLRRPLSSPSSSQRIAIQHQSASIPVPTPSASSAAATAASYIPSLLRPSSQQQQQQQQTLLRNKELEEFQLYYTGTVGRPYVVDGHTKSVTNNIYEPSVATATTTTSPLVEDNEAEYRRRRDQWAHRYTRLEGLREAFGTNHNKLWGDLDATATRRLYKTLLPNALCELIMDLDFEYKNITPQELAPLAYQARKAAKLYARERCHLPLRVAATLFDGFRALRRYGKFQPAGLSYDQLWEKYQRLILEEEDDDDDDEVDHMSEEEIIARTCLKIMERSCKTNEHIDAMFLSGDVKKQMRDRHQSTSSNNNNNADLEKISQTLQNDVRKLLYPFSIGQQQQQQSVTSCNPHHDSRTTATSDSSSSSSSSTCMQSRPKMTQQQYHALRHFALARRQQQLESSSSAAVVASASSVNS